MGKSRYLAQEGRGEPEKDREPWVMEDVGDVLNLYYLGRGTREIADKHSRRLRSIETVINKAFWTSKDKKCHIRSHFTGQGVKSRSGILWGPRELRKCFQGMTNKMPFDLLAKILGRSVEEIEGVKNRTRRRPNRKGFELE